MTTRFILLILLSASLSFCNSQDRMDIHQLATPNPTSHVFNLSVSILKDSLTKFFSFKEQDSNKYLNRIFFNFFHSDTSSKLSGTFGIESLNPYLGRKYLKTAEIKRDLYLFYLDDTWLSVVYYANSKPMKFKSEFILHFERLTPDKTLLTVIADEPRVINGMDGFGVHGPKRREQKVKATTIEEYTLILYIASKLGENNLPPLKLPDN